MKFALTPNVAVIYLNPFPTPELKPVYESTSRLQMQVPAMALNDMDGKFLLFMRGGPVGRRLPLRATQLADTNPRTWQTPTWGNRRDLNLKLPLNNKNKNLDMINQPKYWLATRWVLVIIVPNRPNDRAILVFENLACQH